MIQEWKYLNCIYIEFPAGDDDDSSRVGSVRVVILNIKRHFSRRTAEWKSWIAVETFQY